jgi:hypothetical protein
MAALSESDRVFVSMQRFCDRLAPLERKTAVIEDQNIGQFRELENIKNMLSSFGFRCGTKHAELGEDRHQKDSHLGERLQRIETVVWLIGSTVSILALILGGGVLAKFLGRSSPT